MEINNNIILQVAIDRASELEKEIIQYKAISMQQNILISEKDREIKELNIKLESKDSK